MRKVNGFFNLVLSPAEEANKRPLQAVNYSTEIKPASDAKANVVPVLLDLTESRNILVITQNGVAATVMQAITS